MALPPYPERFRTAPGAPEIVLTEERYGRYLLLLGRFDRRPYLRARWAPLHLGRIPAMARCLTVHPPAALASPQAFTLAESSGPPGGVPDRDFLVCAPPLDGPQAFALAETFGRPDGIPDHIVKAIGVLDLLGPLSDTAITGVIDPFLWHFAKSADSWQKSFRAHIQHIEHPEYMGKSDSYHGRDVSFRVADALTWNLKQFARWGSDVRETLRAETPDPNLTHLVLSVARQLAEVDRSEHLETLIETGLRHPETVVSLVHSPELHDYLPHCKSDAIEDVLNFLYREELRTIGGCLKISVEDALRAPFVLTLQEAVSIVKGLGRKSPSTHIASEDEAKADLNTYVGGYLDDLDLSRSYITGSAAMSAVLRPRTRRYFKTHEDFLACYYPPQYTRRAADTRGRDVRNFFRTDPGEVMFVDHGAEDGGDPRVELCYATEGGEQHSLLFDIVPGADVDIAVDARGEEFDAIAGEHLACVQAAFPDAPVEMVAVTENRQHPMYKITCLREPRPAGFREVEIYPADWLSICTHHLGTVRLAYTAAEAAAPRFLLTASAVAAAASRASPNYYYFASKKVSPQDVILKYLHRGYAPPALPRRVRQQLVTYAAHSALWKSSRLDYILSQLETFSDDVDTNLSLHDRYPPSIYPGPSNGHYDIRNWRVMLAALEEDPGHSRRNM